MFASLHLTLRPQTQRVLTSRISGKVRAGSRNKREVEGGLQSSSRDHSPRLRATSHRHCHGKYWPCNSQHFILRKPAATRTRVQHLQESAPKFYCRCFSQYFRCIVLALAQLIMYWFNIEAPNKPLPPLCTLISFTSMVAHRWEKAIFFSSCIIKKINTLFFSCY